MVKVMVRLYVIRCFRSPFLIKGKWKGRDKKEETGSCVHHSQLDKKEGRL